MKRVLLGFGIALWAVSGAALAAFDRDHPLFSAYPGADLSRALMFDYESFSFPVSLVEDSQNANGLKTRDTIGDLYKHYYTIENTSSLKVYENYLAAATKAEFKPLLSCQLDACGNEEQINGLGQLISVDGNVYNYWRKPYYWVGEKVTPKGKILVAWFIGSYEDTVAVHQVIVEEEPLETGLVKVNASYAPGTEPVNVEPLSEDEKANDHELLPRYPGAKLFKHEKVDTQTVTLPFAITESDKAPLQLTGDLGRHTYTIANVSTLKVYENYKAALSKAGFSFISRCELTQCGSEKQANDLGDQVALTGSVYNWYRQPYYLLAQKGQGAGSTYVALFIGSYEDTVGVQQIVLKERQVQTGLVTVNADQLKQQLDAEGKVLIYGIYFDTGKAVIKSESKPALDAIAELMKRNGELLLYVVGHTDDTGDSAANLQLSAARANSVVDALTSGYNVPPHRLQAQGVGPFAPAADNLSEAGKQKNRRVELVKRLR